MNNTPFVIAVIVVPVLMHHETLSEQPVENFKSFLLIEQL